MIPATLEHKKNTEIMRELFNFTNNLLTDTDVYRCINIIEPVQNLIENLADMI